MAPKKKDAKKDAKDPGEDKGALEATAFAKKGYAASSALFEVEPLPLQLDRGEEGQQLARATGVPAAAFHQDVDRMEVAVHSYHRQLEPSPGFSLGIDAAALARRVADVHRGSRCGGATLDGWRRHRHPRRLARTGWLISPQSSPSPVTELGVKG